jgi:hypothetical protein
MTTETIDAMSPKKRAELFEKLQAIQEHIKRAANDGEAANAIAAMRRLLTKYNLEEAQIAGHREDSSRVIGEWIDFSTAHRTFAWEEILAWAVAESYYCATKKTPNRDPESGELLRRMLLFVGRATDVAICKVVFVAVRARVIAFANRSMKLYIDMLRDKGVNASLVRGEYSIKTMRISYLSGMAVAIKERLEAQREKEATEETTALVISRQNEIAEYMGGKVEGRSTKITTNDIMYSLGYQDGQLIDLAAPPEDEETPLLLEAPKS